MAWSEAGLTGVLLPGTRSLTGERRNDGDDVPGTVRHAIGVMVALLEGERPPSRPRRRRLTGLGARPTLRHLARAIEPSCLSAYVRAKAHRLWAAPRRVVASGERRASVVDSEHRERE